ncbi:MAG TPA: FixH family protein [Alphaproteobacteria bacterium]
MRSRFMTSMAAALTMAMSMTRAFAAPKDYRFEAVSPIVEPSRGNRVAIRLIHLPTNKVIRDAMVVGTGLKMPMNGMSSMNGSVQASRTSGTLEFTINVPMAGDWLLDITAKIPEEAEVIHGLVPLHVETSQPPVSRDAHRPSRGEEQSNDNADC